MKTLSIKPAAHRKVTDPRTGFLLSADQSTSVPASAYWLRRLKFGEVVLAEDEEVVDIEEAVAPKKRGRPRKIERENEA